MANGQQGGRHCPYSALGVLATFGILLFPATALAQQMPGEDARPPEQVQEEARPPQQQRPPGEAELPYLADQILRQSAWVLSTTVREAVGRRLAPPPVSTGDFSPLGFVAGAGDGIWLAYDGDASGSAGGAQAGPLWTVWANPSVTWSRHNDPIVGNEGHLLNLALGVDYRIVERGVLGVLFNHERADFDMPPSLGTFENRGNGIGAYGGYALTDVIVIDGLVMWKTLDNEVADPGSSGRFDSRRWLAAGNVTAYLYYDQLRVSPTAGVIWSRERQDSYVTDLGLFNPGRVISTTTVNLGGQLGYGFDLANGARVEPWVGVTGSWDVARSQRPPPAVPGRELDRFDITVTPGLNVQFTQHATFSLRADFAGLARSGYRQTTVGGQLNVQF